MLDVAMVSVVFLKFTNKPTPTPPSFNCGSNSRAIVELKNYTYVSSVAHGRAAKTIQSSLGLNQGVYVLEAAHGRAAADHSI